MKVGVYSGTFDPIHNGHLEFAKLALKEAGLDQVNLLIERKPWRKEHYSDYKVRLEMLEIATKSEPKLKSDMQLKHTTHNFEESVKEFERIFGKEADIYLLMGGDVFEHIENWDNFEKLIKEFKFIVALRTEDDGEIIMDIKTRQPEIDLVMVPSPLSIISSSRIRNAIKFDQNPDGLDQKVYDYIKEHRLYGYADRQKGA